MNYYIINIIINIIIKLADKGEIWKGMQDMHAAVYSVQMVPRSEDEI